MPINDYDLLSMMKEKNLSTEISGLSNFPWTMLSFPELIKLIEDNQIKATVYYAPDFRHIVMTRKEVLFTYILTTIITILPIAFIVFAILTKEWVYLFGISTIFIAMYISNPWAKKTRQTIVLISIGTLLFSLYSQNYALAILSSGLLFSILITKFTRDFINHVLLREIKKSELLFCYTFQYGILLLQETNKDKIYNMR